MLVCQENIEHKVCFPLFYANKHEKDIMSSLLTPILEGRDTLQ